MTPSALRFAALSTPLPTRTRRGIALALLIAEAVMRRCFLALSLVAAIGCEHPDEPDDTAEARAAIPAYRRPQSRVQRWPGRVAPAERPGLTGVTGGQVGPRHSTPGGIASGLHGAATSLGESSAASGTSPAGTNERTGGAPREEPSSSARVHNRENAPPGEIGPREGA